MLVAKVDSLSHVRKGMTMEVNHARRNKMNDWLVLELNDDEKALIREGNFIKAVKQLRERTNSALWDAKKNCDAYRDALPKDWEKLYKELLVAHDKLTDEAYTLREKNYDMGTEIGNSKWELDTARRERDVLSAKLEYSTMLLQGVLKDL